MLQVSYTIVNPEIDLEIKETFKSKQLFKKHLCYLLDGRLYKVLIIHNPEKVKLTAKIEYNTEKHGRLSGVMSCHKKVGIFIDNKAPRALMKHISSFHNLSWWGRFRNLAASNGTKIQQQYTEKKRFSSKYTIYTYTPCTAYEAMINATP